HSTDLQAAYFREHVEGFLRVRPIHLETAFDGRNFSSPGRIVDSRASSDYVSGRSAAQGTKHGCGAAGVADPHLAGAEDKEILQGYLFDEANPGFDGLYSLGSTHGSAAREI